MVRRNLPLHKKLKNMHQQNLTLRKENRNLKQNLQQVDIEEKGNIDFLVEETEI
jgi:hypothetical protein